MVCRAGMTEKEGNVSRTGGQIAFYSKCNNFKGNLSREDGQITFSSKCRKFKSLQENELQKLNAVKIET